MSLGLLVLVGQKSLMRGATFNLCICERELFRCILDLGL